MESPFIVPPFNGKNKRPAERYFWWSWHPLYPYWSKSCWGGITEEDAHKSIQWPEEVKNLNLKGHRIDAYHNKLIRENDDGTLTEVYDLPCARLEIWNLIKENLTKNPDYYNGRGKELI